MNYRQKKKIVKRARCKTYKGYYKKVAHESQLFWSTNAEVRDNLIEILRNSQSNSK